MSNSSQTKLNWTLVFIMAFSAAAAQDGGNVLTSTVGGSVTFPAAVLEDGTLLFGDDNVVIVTDGSSRIYIEDFRRRLQWDRQTGQFTIRELRINDTGIYTLKNLIKLDNAKYHLRVYSPVSLPHISSLSKSKSRSLVRETCSVECSVENGRDVTLSWYRGEERLNQTSSADLFRNLSLSHVLEKNISYSCEAENPVSREAVRLKACRTADSPELPSTDGNRNDGRLWVTTIVAVSYAVVSVVVVILAVYLKRRKPEHSQQQDGSGGETVSGTLKAKEHVGSCGVTPIPVR